MNVSIKIPSSIMKVMEAIVSIGGKPMVVGGAVRDAVMNQEWGIELIGKDLDVEVFGLNFAPLFKTLQKFGQVDLVGADFGVIKFRNEDGEFDFSIPRSDKRLGAGHKNFETTLKPDATFADAAFRRDFTMNAMLWDFTTGEVIDPFGGIVDIQNRILRPVGKLFAEDALRVLRGMQFAARFGMSLAQGASVITLPMIGEFFDLPRERVREEWIKWAERSTIPSFGLIFLIASGWINLDATDEDFKNTDIHVAHIRNQRNSWISSAASEMARKSLAIDLDQLVIEARELFPFDSKIVACSGLFPELQKMFRTPQDVKHHPEGNVFIHTSIGTDEMVAINNRDGVFGEKRGIRAFGILLHDTGKPSTTVFEADGRITSAHHAEEGEWPTRTFMHSIGFGGDKQKSAEPTVEAVVTLVTKHMVHVTGGGQLSDGTIRRLSLTTDLRDLAAVVEADHSSRPPKEKGLPEEMARIVKRADELQVLDAAPKPILKGQHLIDCFGWKQGKHFKAILDAAKEAQMDGAFSDETGAIIWAGVEIASGRFTQG